MAKHGFMSFLPEILGGAALLATGAGAAGIGPLSGLFSSGAAGADAAASAATDVAGSAVPAATDAGLAATLNAAPATVGGVASDVATPLAAGAPSLAADINSPISAAAGDLASAGPSFSNIASALPSANTLLGDATSITSGGGAPNITAPLSMDVGYAPGAAPGGAINAASAGAGGGYDPSLTPPGGSMGGDTTNQDFSGGAPGSGSDTSGVNGFLQSLKNNPLQLAGLAPLAMAFMQSNSPVPGSAPVTQAAQTAAQTAGGLTSQSNQNLSYANTGALPAGVNESINNAANAAKTQVKSSFAGMGIPPGSSMEREQLAAVDANAGAQRVAAANQLTTLGIQEAQAATGQQQIASNQDIALMNAQIQQEKDLEDALAGFSKSLAGPVTSTAGAANTNTTPAVA
jgi:hypothetical protein